MKKQALDPDLLYKPCNIENFHFKDTSELENIDIFLGQDRAIDSIQFGMRVNQRGYNIFALAPSGTGKLTTILQLVKHESQQHPDGYVDGGVWHGLHADLFSGWLGR